MNFTFKVIVTVIVLILLAVLTFLVLNKKEVVVKAIPTVDKAIDCSEMANYNKCYPSNVDKE